MSVAQALLGLLEGKPRHGYQLKLEYDARFAEVWPVQFGQIYSTLGRLQRRGLVTPEGKEPGRGPDRKLYVITGDGVSDLERWLATPEPSTPHVQSVLFMKVVVALLSGRDAERFLNAQRQQHMKKMRELTRLKTKPTAATSEILLSDYGIFHLEADLRWIDAASQRLDRLRGEVVR